MGPRGPQTIRHTRYLYRYPALYQTSPGVSFRRDEFRGQLRNYRHRHVARLPPRPLWPLHSSRNLSVKTSSYALSYALSNGNDCSRHPADQHPVVATVLPPPTTIDYGLLTTDSSVFTHHALGLRSAFDEGGSRSA